jgi:hypothetical protein
MAAPTPLPRLPETELEEGQALQRRNIAFRVLPDGPSPKDLDLGQKNLVSPKTNYLGVCPAKMLASFGTLRTAALFESAGSLEILPLILDGCGIDREP